MADSPKYFKASVGVTDGMVHYEPGSVFPASEALTATYARTGGKAADGTVQFESATQKEFAEYSAANADPVGDAMVDEDGVVALGAGAPSAHDVVGGGAYENIASEDVADGPRTTTADSGAQVEVAVDQTPEEALKADAEAKGDATPL